MLVKQRWIWYDSCTLSSEDNQAQNENTKEPRQRKNVIGGAILFLGKHELLPYLCPHPHMSQLPRGKRHSSLCDSATLWEVLKTPSPRSWVDPKHCETAEVWERQINDEVYFYKCHLGCPPAIRQKYPSETNLYAISDKPRQQLQIQMVKKHKKLCAARIKNCWISWNVK